LRNIPNTDGITVGKRKVYPFLPNSIRENGPAFEPLSYVLFVNVNVCPSQSHLPTNGYSVAVALVAIAATNAAAMILRIFVSSLALHFLKFASEGLILRDKLILPAPPQNAKGPAVTSTVGALIASGS
jgi:hypothetical protein